MAYLGVTFGVSWGLWIPAGIALGTFDAGVSSSLTMVALVALGMFCPLVGALVANGACDACGRLELGVRLRLPGMARHLLAAWLTPLALVLAGGVVFFALNPDRFDPTCEGYLATVLTMAETGGLDVSDFPSAREFSALMPLMLVFSVTLAPFVNVLPAFGEEVGWRSLLLPTLSELMGERRAVLVSGAIWGLWHAPIIAMGHNFGFGYAGFPVTGILVMMLSCMALSAWLSLPRLRSGSVWPCALAHGAFNAVANLGLICCTGGPTLAGPSPLGYVAGIPLYVWGLVCLLRAEQSR